MFREAWEADPTPAEEALKQFVRRQYDPHHIPTTAEGCLHPLSFIHWDARR